MPATISVHRHGELVGACTASCYDADASSACRCICGGENHGVGRLEAMAHAHDLSVAWQGDADPGHTSCAHAESRQVLLGGRTWARATP